MKKLKTLDPTNGNGQYLHTYKAKYDDCGTEIPYEIVSRHGWPEVQEHGLGTKTDAVCIVPIFDNGDLLVTREFRYAINGYCLEFPAGLIDPGETPVEAAKRELKEETGLNTEKVLFTIPGGYSSAGMTDEKVAIVGLLVSGNFYEMQGKEEIHPIRTNVNRLYAMVADGDSCSARMQCLITGIHLARSAEFCKLCEWE